MFYQIKMMAGEKGKNNVFFRATLLPLWSFGREVPMGDFPTYEEAEASLMDPFNPYYMEELEDHDWLVLHGHGEGEEEWWW